MLAARRGRASQADLRRAVSTAYYAMFHALSDVCASSFLGARSPDRCERAWTQAYRAVDHRKAREACRKCADEILSFPPAIQSFAKYFVTMQALRTQADYNPNGRYSRHEVLGQIDGAGKAIAALNDAPARHRKAFAAFVLLRFPSTEA